MACIAAATAAQLLPLPFVESLWTSAFEESAADVTALLLPVDAPPGRPVCVSCSLSDGLTGARQTRCAAANLTKGDGDFDCAGSLADRASVALM